VTFAPRYTASLSAEAAAKLGGQTAEVSVEIIGGFGLDFGITASAHQCQRNLSAQQHSLIAA
jgi:hypothetical protein